MSGAKGQLTKSFIAEILYLKDYEHFDTGYSFFIYRSNIKTKNKNGEIGSYSKIFSLFELLFVFEFSCEVIGNIHEKYILQALLNNHN